MATNYTNTLAGMLLLNDQNMAAIYPDGVLDDAPVMAKASAIPASQGTVHKYLRRNTAATVGFRELSTGVTNAAEVFEDVTCTLKILDASFTRDVALADAFKKGRAAYIQAETQRSLRSGMFALERAIFNFNISTQFIGLPYFNDYADTDNGQIVDAGGAGGKSVWLIRWGEDAVSVIAGNDGKISMLWDDDNPTVVQVYQADQGATKPYSAYRVTLQGYFGLQVGSKYDVVRIANLDGTSDDLLTDDLISDALAKFPAARPPNMIVMNRTALKELQQSRTATNPTGAPAPFPSEAFGVPIVVTDALGTSEATVNASTTTTTTSSSV
jgi:hypothetical protein